MPLIEKNVNVIKLAKNYTAGEAVNPVLGITVKWAQEMPSNGLSLREILAHVNILPEGFGKG